MRRAIVKTRLVRLSGKALGPALAHLRYIQRDGAGRDGSPGRLYSATEDDADGRRFMEGCGQDRHQFRIIISAEDGAQYEELRPLVRRFMDQMEKDLGTGLEWVAADHSDTGHPHSHIILRGKDDRGKNLIIARDYIAHGMRERLAQLVSRDLGPRTSLEIQQQMARDVGAERLTPLDRSLVRSVGEDGTLVPGGRNMAEHSIRLARLRKLEGLGLAAREEGGRWRLADAFDERLRAIGERGDIIRTMQRAMSRSHLNRGAGDLQIYRAELGDLVGRLVERGLSDELRDRHYLIVDAVDGRTYYVDAGAGSSLESTPPGALLKIGPGNTPGVARVELQSALPLHQLPAYVGATWLDQEIGAADPLPLRDAGFGKEVKAALLERRAWLMAQGFVPGEDGLVGKDALELLRARDLSIAGARLSAESGLFYVEPGPGQPVEGILRRRVDLGSGSFAMVENGREFALLPWKPMLSRAIGQEVNGLIHERAVSWSIGRERGPVIS